MTTQIKPASIGDQNQSVEGADLAEIIDCARDFAENELLSRALAVDLGEAEAFDQCWQGVEEIGLDRALLPEAAGGVELGVSGLLSVLEELAVGEAGIALLTLLSNAALRCAPDRGGAEGSSGRFGLVLLPEPGAPNSQGVNFNGEAVTGKIEFALGAYGATGLVLVAPVASGGRAVLVDALYTGFVAEREAAQLGLRGARAATIEFSATHVEPIGGAQVAHETEILLHAGSAAIARGIARRAHAVALEYAEERYQGGSMIVEYGAVRDMLARISERNRREHEIYGAVRFGESGQRSGDEALAHAISLKTAITDDAVESTIDAVQVFGGMGYMHETGVEKLMRDAKYCQLFPRSNWLARDELTEIDRRNS